MTPTASLYIVDAGVFEESTHALIAGAEVKLIDFDGPTVTIQERFTGQDGRCQFVIPYCGTCFATAQHPDYNGNPQAFAGTTSPRVVINFYLQR